MGKPQNPKPSNANALPRLSQWQKARDLLLLLMIKILHYLKDPKLWELWYIPYYG